jgi:hypothetical protein
MNTIFKSKSQLRTETEDALQAYLAAGGKIEVIKARKAPKPKMSGKSTRSVSKNQSLGFRTSNFGG